jgi:acetyl esterase/lipase
MTRFGRRVFANIHPELQPIARRAALNVDFSSRSLWLFRLAMKLMRAPAAPEDIRITNTFIPRSDRGRIALRIYTPKALPTPTPVLVWLHGGGYVFGKPEMDDLPCTHYARELGIVVVSVDYRLAPENPFPAGLEDTYAALQWVEAHASELSVDASRIAVGGASAGAGLAASVVQMAHDRGMVRPVFQLLIYPMLDERTVLRTDLDDSGNVTWSQRSNRFAWEAYLGTTCGVGVPPPYAAPARRADLTGLAAAWIGVGSLDLFHDEDLAYAHRLLACGVECEIATVPGAFHGFDVFGPQLPVVQAFRDSQIAALRKHLFPARY